MRRVVVTGGAGFLGARICERLLERGDSVHCLDNLHTGSRSNILRFASHSNFSFREWDICNEINLDADEIYNFACPASPPHYQADPVKTMKVSVFGVLNMLELARRKGARIIQASTSEIYGDPLIHPQKETYWGNVNSTGIRACYDEGKRAAETLMYDYHRIHGVDIRVVRIFNTYGPGMNPGDGRVVSNFIVQALQEHDITIYGDGSQTRSFCYRDDLVDGIVRLMEAPEGTVFPVNIGNPVEFTVRQLADLVLELTGSRSRLVFKPLPQDDPVQRCPDITRAREHLGWEPKVPLREGLLKTIEYFDDVLHARQFQAV